MSEPTRWRTYELHGVDIGFDTGHDDDRDESVYRCRTCGWVRRGRGDALGMTYQRAIWHELEFHFISHRLNEIEGRP